MIAEEDAVRNAHKKVAQISKSMFLAPMLAFQLYLSHQRSPVRTIKSPDILQQIQEEANSNSSLKASLL